MSKDPLAVVQGAYAAFGRGDVEAILAGVTPDVSWEVNGEPGAYPIFGRFSGVAGVAAFFKALSEAAEFSKFEPYRLHAAGETVIVEGREAFTVRRTGKQAATEWVQIFTVRGGKIASFREFTDTATVIKAYG